MSSNRRRAWKLLACGALMLTLLMSGIPGLGNFFPGLAGVDDVGVRLGRHRIDRKGTGRNPQKHPPHIAQYFHDYSLMGFQSVYLRF